MGRFEWEGRRSDVVGTCMQGWSSEAITAGAVVGTCMQGRSSEAVTAGAGTLPTIDMPAGRHHLS